MPVLIEGISVVIKRAAIDEKYPGGFVAFETDAPLSGWLDTLCADNELARVGFMAPADVGWFCDRLAKHGIGTAERPVDLVVVDQLTGPTTPCDWVEVWNDVEVTGGEVSACRLRGSTDETLVVPGGWTYASSITKNTEFIPNSAADTLEFVRAEGPVQIWRDRLTGEEGFIGRATSAVGEIGVRPTSPKNFC